MLPPDAKVAVLVPAHDEEAVIGATLALLGSGGVIDDLFLTLVILLQLGNFRLQPRPLNQILSSL